jgi:hypothetical protein
MEQGYILAQEIKNEGWEQEITLFKILASSDQKYVVGDEILIVEPYQKLIGDMVVVSKLNIVGKKINEAK